MQRKQLLLLGGAGVGAMLMYLLDPARGKRRRALMRDKVISALNKTADAAGATARDMMNRTRALDLRRMFQPDDVSDDVLAARVRSKMGRVVMHPSAVEVSASQGRVALSGPILAHEVDDLLTCVSKIPGVRDVENRLEVYKQADDVPALQGGAPRPGDRFELMQENWSPTARVLTSVAGASLLANGLRRRDPLSILLGTLGSGLLLRGLTNREMKRLTGIGAGRRAVEMQKDINIAAPVDRVYEFWSNIENFPRFMANVLEVRDTGDGHSHWKVKGPAGVPLQWDAVVTEQQPNRLLAWKSVEGASVAHSGIVRFDPNDDGTTRLEIRLSYNPPAGAIGHGVATLLGANPKREMDADLLRMKTLIETGNPPHDSAARSSRPSVHA